MLLISMEMGKGRNWGIWVWDNCENTEDMLGIFVQFLWYDTVSQKSISPNHYLYNFNNTF